MTTSGDSLQFKVSSNVRTRKSGAKSFRGHKPSGAAAKEWPQNVRLPSRPVRFAAITKTRFATACRASPSSSCPSDVRKWILVRLRTIRWPSRVDENFRAAGRSHQARAASGNHCPGRWSTPEFPHGSLNRLKTRVARYKVMHCKIRIVRNVTLAVKSRLCFPMPLEDERCCDRFRGHAFQRTGKTMTARVPSRCRAIGSRQASSFGRGGLNAFHFPRRGSTAWKSSGRITRSTPVSFIWRFAFIPCGIACKIFEILPCRTAMSFS